MKHIFAAGLTITLAFSCFAQTGHPEAAGEDTAVIAVINTPWWMMDEPEED